MQRLPLTLCLLLSLSVVFTPGTASADRLGAKARAQQRVEQYQQERLREAAPVDLFSSFYSISGQDESFLVALNTVPYPVSFEISALSPSGASLPLGRYEIPPSRHLWLSLRDLIGGASPGDWDRGSVRVSFLGDTGSLQGWMVIRRGSQAFEIALQAVSETDGNELTAFWDTTSWQGTGTGAVYIVNAGNRPLRYRAIGGGDADLEDEMGSILGPGQQATITPGGKHSRSWVRILHDGERGALIGTTLIESDDQLGLGGLSHGGPGEVRNWETARTLLDAAVGVAQARVTLLNAAAESNHARVLAVSPVTGTPLAEWNHNLGPGEVLSVALTPRLARLLGDLTDQEIRVRVEAREPGLLVTGESRMSDGEILEMSFLPVRDAHAAGSYPIPSLVLFDVELTLANLDTEDSRVVAQFFWDGGTYSFGPVTVPSGTNYRLNIADLIDQHGADLLGRTLPRELPGGFLKWKVVSGSRHLLGRTEARFRDSRDRVGFNCFGCCYEVPFASVEPSFVEFEAGQSPLFQACVSYDTCSGTMGPYPFNPTSMTVPSPFSWDGVNVSASSEAEEELSFFGLEEEHQPNCFTINVPIEGIGTADSCKPLLRKPHNPTESWSNTQACNLQDNSLLAVSAVLRSAEGVSIVQKCPSGFGRGRVPDVQDRMPDRALLKLRCIALSSLQVPIAGVLLLIAGAAAPLEARGDGGDGDPSRAAYWEYSWESPSGATGPRGLRLWDKGAGGYAMRLLVSDDERQWRLIMTETLDPRRGVHATELRDDVSGWWIRLEHRPGVRGETLDDYFAKGRELPPMDEASGFLDYRLTASGDVSYRPRVPARDATGPIIWDGLFEQLAEAGLGETLSEDVPARFRDAVLFLDASLVEMGSELGSGGAESRPREWPGLLGLVARLLRSELPSDHPSLKELSAPWTMRQVGPIRRGSSLVEPELLELASRFRSVENSDPLAGSRVEDFAARWPPSD